MTGDGDACCIKCRISKGYGILRRHLLSSKGVFFALFPVIFCLFFMILPYKKHYIMSVTVISHQTIKHPVIYYKLTTLGTTIAGVKKY